MFSTDRRTPLWSKLSCRTLECAVDPVVWLETVVWMCKTAASGESDFTGKQA